MTESDSKVIANAMQYKKSRTKWDVKLFTLKSKEIFGEKYDYSCSEFVAKNKKIKIRCREHGLFEQRPNDHLRGYSGCSGCMSVNRKKPKLGKRLTQEDFVEKATKVHNGRYSYGNSVFTTTREKLLVTCPNHGDFLVQANNHLRGQGCKSCQSENQRHSGKEVIEKFKKKHGDRYDYSKTAYKGNHEKVEIICKTHGSFWQTPATHYSRGSGCKKCAPNNPRTEKEILNKFREVHGIRYDYSKVKYLNMDMKVRIICKDHGDFLQTPYQHLLGSGCPTCAKGLVGWQRKNYTKLCSERHNGESSIYIVKISDSYETFYKIGITVRKNVKQRFPGSSLSGYKVESIRQVFNSADFIWNLEKRLLKMSEKYKYRPKLSFGGETECFSKIPKEVYKLLDSIDKSDQLQLIA